MSQPRREIANQLRQMATDETQPRGGRMDYVVYLLMAAIDEGAFGAQGVALQGQLDDLKTSSQRFDCACQWFQVNAHNLVALSPTFLSAPWTDRSVRTNVLSLATLIETEISEKDGQSPQPAMASGDAPAPNQLEYSLPMSKTEMMVRLNNMPKRQFATFAKQHGLRQAGNRQSFEIRLDQMDADKREKLTGP